MEKQTNFEIVDDISYRQLQDNPAWPSNNSETVVKGISYMDV